MIPIRLSIESHLIFQNVIYTIPDSSLSNDIYLSMEENIFKCKEILVGSKKYEIKFALFQTEVYFELIYTIYQPVRSRCLYRTDLKIRAKIMYVIIIV